MGQKKLIRFEAIKSFPNVLQYPEGMAGQWGAFFPNNQPLTLELACGKGEYTVGLARMYPDRNFLGVDMKGNRIYIGAKRCLEGNISNAAFLRTHIDKIGTYFQPGEVEEIWLTFPDPQLRKSRATRRLTHPRFIRLYQRILSPGGRVHLKTDSPILYQFTKWVIAMYGLSLLEDNDDIYRGEVMEELKIKTHYEGLDIARSKKVHYLCFTIPEGPLPNFDVQLLGRIKEEEPVPATPVRPPRIHAASRQAKNASSTPQDEAAD
ncbi:tRNA (guanosine(46)-N7)-methyltransferase TrmB [Puia sp.]|jgi:tRNA (guanine-N7-)-methyltransferase|uniref:tRNA (guanosine(46)-N7)-methyltransferase TrmB n=1 Tax=Puia sp. TaxID=2045100 RepID=UPI002F4072A7